MNLIEKAEKKIGIITAVWALLFALLIGVGLGYTWCWKALTKYEQEQTEVDNSISFYASDHDGFFEAMYSEKNDKSIRCKS